MRRNVLLALVFFSVPAACGVLAACSRANPSSPDTTSAPEPPSRAVPSVAASVPPLRGFEGAVVATMTDSKSNDRSFSFDLLVKGDELRISIPEPLLRKFGAPPGDAPYAIFDSRAKKLSLVSDAHKQVMLLDLEKSRDLIQSSLGPPTLQGAMKSPPTKLVKTGRSEIVAGYGCEDWDIRSAQREATLCVSDHGAPWLSLALPNLPPDRAWMSELLDGTHFPLRFIGFGPDGLHEQTRIEVTRIDPKALAASTFNVPADYKTVDLSQMLQGMVGMANGLPPKAAGLPAAR